MERPTKERVDRALSRITGTNIASDEDVLAAEVRALRQEVDATSLKWDEEVLELRAKLARVEALSLKWMDYALFDTGNVADCAKDLEDALRGGE